jgi:hypothetical protein
MQAIRRTLDVGSDRAVQSHTDRQSTARKLIQNTLPCVQLWNVRNREKERCPWTLWIVTRWLNGVVSVAGYLVSVWCGGSHIRQDGRYCFRQNSNRNLWNGSHSVLSCTFQVTPIQLFHILPFVFSFHFRNKISLESFIFSSPIWRRKAWNIHNYNFPCWCVWIRNFVTRVKEST